MANTFSVRVVMQLVFMPIMNMVCIHVVMF